MSKKAIDIDDVLERVQDDHELLMELFDIFQEDFAEKRKTMDDFIQQGDFEQIRNMVHSLKGAAGNISAVDIHATCAKLEHLAESNDLEGIKSLMGSLDEQYKALQSNIAEIKQSFQNS